MLVPEEHAKSLGTENNTQHDINEHVRVEAIFMANFTTFYRTALNSTPHESWVSTGIKWTIHDVSFV